MDEQAIVQILKDEGLDVAEELAMSAVKGAFALLRHLLPRVNTILGVVLVPMLDRLEPIIIDALDKIDGERDLD